MNYLTLAHHDESTVTDIRCVHGAILSIQYQYARRATAYLIDKWMIILVR